MMQKHPKNTNKHRYWSAAVVIIKDSKSLPPDKCTSNAKQILMLTEIGNRQDGKMYIKAQNLIVHTG